MLWDNFFFRVFFPFFLEEGCRRLVTMSLSFLSAIFSILSNLSQFCWTQLKPVKNRSILSAHQAPW